MSPCSAVIFLNVILFNAFRADAQHKNKNVLDLSIAIHYGYITPADVVPVDNLFDFVEEMTDVFEISANKTRMAVVEFGSKEKVWVGLDEGVTQANILIAMEEIGNGSYSEPPKPKYSLVDVAKMTPQLVAIPKDRLHAPTITLIITAATKEELNTAMDSSSLALHGAHILQLDSFDITKDDQVRYQHRYDIRVKRLDSIETLDHTYEIPNSGTLKSVAVDVANDTIGTIRTCTHTESIRTQCYYDRNYDCVADLIYDVTRDKLAIDSKPLTIDQVKSRFRRVLLMYCFKNGSTTACPISSYCWNASVACVSHGYWSCNSSCGKPGWDVWHLTGKAHTDCSAVLRPHPCDDCDQDSENDERRIQMLKTMLVVEVVSLPILIPLAVLIFFRMLKWLKQAEMKRNLMEKHSSRVKSPAAMSKSIIVAIKGIGTKKQLNIAKPIIDGPKSTTKQAAKSDVPKSTTRQAAKSDVPKSTTRQAAKSAVGRSTIDGPKISTRQAVKSAVRRSIKERTKRQMNKSALKK